ncbi:MAG: hypothetical protein L0Y66_02395 [Myxococcaceae bacterium]|nr:hypothetical protein [Myxococcaceae bacterium]MCI0673974.1 hypothetical protein [Myxococcaceae bacterium]
MDTPMQREGQVARVLPGPATWRSAAVTSAIAALESRRQTRWMRGVFAANAVVAGGSGLLLLLAPTTGGHVLFGRARREPFVTATLGSVWLGIGLLSALGLRNPRPLGSVLALQALSEGTWLATVFPRMVRAREERALALAGLLAAWGLATARATPWRELLGRPLFSGQWRARHPC